RQLLRLGVGRRGHQALGAAVLYRPRRRSGARRGGRQRNRDGRLGLRLVLRRRQRGQRERMQAGGEFILQGLVDQTLARDTALALERRRDDLDPEMRFAALAMAGMTAMTRRLVLDRQPRRRKSRPKLVVNRLCYGAHRLPLLPPVSPAHILAAWRDGE